MEGGEKGFWYVCFVIGDGAKKKKKLTGKCHPCI